jgi:16S rRNA (adenine1518-N6/adenine1519-N6)-dimethyltransferase
MADKTPSPRKSLGQHWLDDAASLQAICSAARPGKGDTVLEVGPGPGALTRLLTEKAGRVVAVELDEKLAVELPARAGADNLEVISEDILKLDLGRLPGGYKVVANIPYYLTGKLLRRLSETSNPPSSAVLLLQKEVAERVAAKPGDMSILSVTISFYWDIRLGRTVPAELFTPPPKVDSRILMLKRRKQPLFTDVEPREFFRLVKTGFAQPRKTLLNNLVAGLHISSHEARAIYERASIDPQRRAQTLSMDEWHNLYKSLHT